MIDDSARSAVDRVRSQLDADHPYCSHSLNIHRWIVAWQCEEDALINLRRHLNIRQIMPMPPFQDEYSQEMSAYAPVTILGQNRPDDNKVVLLEHTGKLDVHGIVANARLNPFMRSKFQMMEKLHEAVVKQEERSCKQSGGLLIMDLEGLSFSPSLLSIIAGPYRIMWGTLFEQYPQLIQQILIVNAPAFINLLFQTCQPFIPTDYKEKIIISSSTEILRKYISEDCLPIDYGGRLGEIPYPVSPIAEPEHVYCTMDTVVIPAGGQIVEKFNWNAGMELEFFLQNDESITYWIFYSQTDTKDQDCWGEIYPGCERAALKQIDRWNWTVPRDGFYFIRYGNERAWLFSTSISTAVLDVRTRHRLTALEKFKL